MRNRLRHLIRPIVACVGILLLLGACSVDADITGDNNVGGSDTSSAADPEVSAGDSSQAPLANGLNDPVALMSSPVMSDFWPDNSFENPVCIAIDPPALADVQQEWDCTVDNDALDYSIAIDPEGRMFARYGLTPKSGRTIVTELAIERLQTDHGYAVDIGACSARAYADGSYEYDCETELLDGSGIVAYRIVIADAALGADSPYDLLDVAGP